MFTDVRDLCLRARLDEKARNALAEAGALQSLAGEGLVTQQVNRRTAPRPKRTLGEK